MGRKEELKMEGHIVVFITTKNISEAKRIGHELLNAHLIACANIVKEIQSFYWWQNKINNDQESLLIVKTQKRLFHKIVKKVKIIHSYSVPEIIAIPIFLGEKNYLKWIDDSVKMG